MPKISPLLPELPAEMRVTRVDRARGRFRRNHKTRIRAGFVLVQSRIHVSELDGLMRVWQPPSRADLVRMALRHLIQATQGGLERIERPPSI